MRSLALVLLCLASDASAQAPTLDGVLAGFAALPGLEARFTEEKRIALLASPVRSEGQLYFARPGRLLRRVTQPEPSVSLIAGGRLRMRDGDRVEEHSLGDNPVLRGFVDGFRAILDGDRAGLERSYRVSLVARPEDGEGAWEIVLRPRSRDLARLVREMRMRGTGTTPREMRIHEVNGDETRTVFAQVRARRFSEAEVRRLFRI